MKGMIVKMNKRERVINAVNGKEVDVVPSGFWLHFDENDFFGQNSINAHLSFFEKTETDIMKIMNENIFPYEVPIKSASDWRYIKSYDKNSKFIRDQLEITKRILDKCHEKGIVLLTIHGIVASAWHARGGSAGYEPGKKELLTSHLREDRQAVLDGYARITEALEILTSEALKAGVDGIYYAALGGENYLYNDEEFESCVKPFDLQILEIAKLRKAFNILHMCKDRLNLERYKDYDAEVVNWGVGENNLGLLDGKKIFEGKTILGGLKNRKGVLVDGTSEEIEKEVFNLIDMMGTNKFIIGSDCTLPTELSYERIRTAVLASSKYERNEA